MHTHQLSLLIIFSLVTLTLSSNINPVSPPQLVNKFNGPITAHLSPIGYRPLSGKLEGVLLLANPIGACSQLQQLDSEHQDIFVLADDTECLQSVKAKNIANSGGYVGIIKQNRNNTLHDKEINLVHIPILEIPASQYMRLQEFMKGNPDKIVSLSIDFTDISQTHPVNVQVWFSPTERQSYLFLLDIKSFIQRQSDVVSFTPHYVLQSQRESKNYIGCLSSGRYCPTEIEYEGKYQGKNIVEQTLRQILIWDTSKEDWWKYIQYFYKNCLENNADIFMNTTKLNYCSENAEIMAGIDTYKLMKQYNSSFLGSRKEVDDNTLLLEERQHYIREQITSHPIVLINKKAIELNSEVIRERICKMEGDSATAECRTAPSGLSTTQMLVIVSVILAMFVGVAALYRLYIHIRMRTEIKSEVQKTLEQYYRYIQTFEGQNGEVGSSKKDKKKKEKFRQLNEQMQEVTGQGEAKLKEDKLREDKLREVEMQDVGK